MNVTTTGVPAALQPVGQLRQVLAERTGPAESGTGLVEEPPDRTEGVLPGAAVDGEAVRRGLVGAELDVATVPVASGLVLFEVLVEVLGEVLGEVGGDVPEEAGLLEDPAHSQQAVVRGEAEGLRPLLRTVVPEQ
ncbi:hypothetical protein GCM10020229_57880 [Kitasatospora albolonga]